MDILLQALFLGTAIGVFSTVSYYQLKKEEDSYKFDRLVRYKKRMDHMVDWLWKTHKNIYEDYRDNHSLEKFNKDTYKQKWDLEKNGGL